MRSKRNFKLLGNFKPDRILISPGPGRPRNAGISLSLVREISKMKEPIPIFGVCLGHQVIGEAFGAKSVRQNVSCMGKFRK